MKDGRALESILLAPFEGVKIIDGTTKVQQWMPLLTALKLRCSQVSLWADLTYHISFVGTSGMVLSVEATYDIRGLQNYVERAKIVEKY